MQTACCSEETLRLLASRGALFAQDPSQRRNWYIFSIWHDIGPEKRSAPEKEGLLRDRGVPVDPKKRAEMMARIHRELLAAVRSADGFRDACQGETP